MNTSKHHVVRRRIAQAGVVLVVCGLVAFAGMYLTTKYQEQIVSAASALRRQTEPYTELYFGDPSKLPLNVASGREMVFGFVITNHEVSDMDYTYRVTVSAPGMQAPQVVREETINLKRGDGIEKAVRYTPSASGQLYTFRIELVGRSEQISFRSQT